RTSPLSVTHPVLSHPPAALSFVLFSPSTTPTEIYTLSLHDALPISCYLLLNILFLSMVSIIFHALSYYNPFLFYFFYKLYHNKQDRKSTRLNSSHVSISYAVFCLKKKNTWFGGLGLHVRTLRRGSRP